jgi:hypothetical protein
VSQASIRTRALENARMKRTLLIILLVLFVTPLLMGSQKKPAKNKKQRLTVINKSGVEIFIQLVGITQSTTECDDFDYFYGLTIPEGTREQPTVREFTVYRDVYEMTVFYVETWDPVYGYLQCGGKREAVELNMFKNQKLNFPECEIFYGTQDELTLLKWWQPKFPFLFQFQIP